MPMASSTISPGMFWMAQWIGVAMSDALVQKLRDLLEFDKNSGALTWKQRGVEMFVDARSAKIWNTRFSGKVAGWKSGNGYIGLSIDGGKQLAHRAIWAMVHGEFPQCDIDHINGDRTDNRLCNLRAVSRAENLQNLRSAKVSNMSSGILGVSKNHNGWRARITLDGKEISLGTCKTKEEACARYLNAKREMHPCNTL